VPVPPFFEQGRPERQPPNLVSASDRDANARQSFWKREVPERRQHYCRRQLKHKIEPTAGQATFEARRCYWLGTQSHGAGQCGCAARFGRFF